MDLLILIPLLFSVLLGSAIQLGGAVLLLGGLAFIVARMFTAVLARPLIALLADSPVFESHPNLAGLVPVFGRILIVALLLAPFGLITWKLLSHEFERWQRHAIGAVCCVPMGYALTQSFGLVGGVAVCTAAVITLVLMMYSYIRDAVSIPPYLKLDFHGAQARYDESYTHKIQKREWRQEIREEIGSTLQ